MRGVINHSKKSSGSYFFIMGEDGVEYFTNYKFMVNDKQYDRYCYVGNKCTFDPAPPPDEGKAPTAVNVVLDEVLDPNYEKKKLLKKQEKERAALNAERKRLYKEQCEIAHRNHVAKMEFLANHTKYVIQYHEHHDWLNLMQDGKPFIYDTAEEAKAKSKAFKLLYPDVMFRFRKIITP